MYSPYYLQESDSSEMWGPYTYYQADHVARTKTRLAAKTGKGPILLYLVTEVGNRPGDPARPVAKFVVCQYIAGRKTSGGRAVPRPM